MVTIYWTDFIFILIVVFLIFYVIYKESMKYMHRWFDSEDEKLELLKENKQLKDTIFDIRETIK